MREEIKSLAKQQIKGKIGRLFVIELIVAACSLIASYIPIIGGIANIFVLTPAFAIATTMIYLRVSENGDFAIGDVFNGFDKFWAAFKVQFLMGFFTLLWSILLIIPGIIKSISYSMSMYILAENPQMGALDAINESKNMMEGHKAEYFVLGLSFIGWILLCMITFGVALIYVIPYMETTMANFYRRIKTTEGYQEPIYANIEE